jgi:hypothetical protein
MSVTGRRPLLALATVAATTAALAFGVSGPAGAAPAPAEDTGLLRTVTLGADLGFPSSQATGTPAGIQSPELPPAEQEGGTDRSNTLDRGFARVSPTGVPIVAPTAVDGSPSLMKSFMGLDGFDQRYANNGNQFSVEPPDQALCVGGGYVMEAVNDVLQVYSPSGAAATKVTDLNTFLGYPAAINRTTGKFGPFVTDPVCLFDEGVQRFFFTALTLDVDPATGDFTTTNHLDIAVSKTANPLDGFAIYRLPVTDNGNAGTPSHKGCPCIGDYPHIGADKYGYYISTNEYPFSDAPGIFGNNFNGAQIYAFDKMALAARTKNVNVVQFSKTQIEQNGKAVPGFTVSPAMVPDTAYQTANNGTEYFLSSIAGEEAQPQGFTGQADAIGVYTLTDTASLSAKKPMVKLMKALRPSERYVQPPFATQKLGPTPLADFCSQVDCWGFGPQQAAEGPIATNDTRMLQVYLANGMLYGALNTGVQVSGQLQAGIAWFLVNPGTSPDTASVAHQGYIGVTGHNVMFPAVAAMTNGKGAMVYTLSGPSYYPTAAYSLVGTSGVTGAVNIAATGVGPQDGFSEYAPEGDAGSAPRPRWGDYSAAEAVGSTIWLATEYIGQSCSFAQYQADQTCGNTRAPLINWATRIAAVTP